MFRIAHTNGKDWITDINVFKDHICLPELNGTCVTELET